jgi:hypothetical protein
MDESTDDIRSIKRELLMGIHGPETARDLEPDEFLLEDLLWDVGNMRRQLSDAHNWCSTRGLPKTTASTEKLTLRGRLEKLS